MRSGTICLFWFLGTLAGCTADELPLGWEVAARIDSLTQAKCHPYTPDERVRETVVATVEEGAVHLEYDAAHFRCAQEVEAFARTVGHDVDVLVQPIDMNPSAVAKCDCRYDIAMTIDGLDKGKTAVGLYRRWDNYNTPNDTKLVGSAKVEIP